MSTNDRPSTAPALAVLAEDLQGALTTASRLQQRGLRVRLLTSQDEPFPAVDAVIVDLSLTNRLDDPQLLVEQWIRSLRSRGVGHVEVRIDPTLHGSPADMVHAALAASGRSAPLWVMMAYPSAGRALIDGRLLFPEATGIAVDLDVRELLDLEDAVIVSLETVTAGAEAVADSAAAAAASGARALLFDSTTEAHLDTIAAAASIAQRRGLEVITASSGAWLRFFPDLGRDGYAIVAASGIQSADRTQLARIADLYGGRSMALSTEQARTLSEEHLSRMLAEHRVIVVQARENRLDDPAVIARDIGESVRHVLDLAAHTARPCLGIVASGGLTTSEVIHRLDAEELLPGNELEPLCPVVRISGGPHDRLAVISKSGSVGSPETLVRLVRRVIGS